MWKTLLTAVAAVTVVTALAVSCSGGSRNLCTDRQVRCEQPLICDPDDGLCKCGGRGGTVCDEGSTCDAIANTCISTRCAGVVCSGGTSCDVTDAKCKCGGTGGKVCATGDVCNPDTKACVPALDCTQVACPKNQTCESSTGRCLCGAATCEIGKFCSPGPNNTRTCVADLCSGVTCTGNNVCDPSDGYCKCNGVLCQSGEACACTSSDGGSCEQSARTCRSGSACAGVTCGGNTTCDPVDGLCKCGGPGGPVCSSVQICMLGPPAQCQGGQQCLAPDGGAKACAGGTSCDPEDGQCKCGGRGGRVCKPASGSEPAEVCVATPFQMACRRPCDPRTPDCPSGTYCYFDPTAATPAAYCAAPTETREEEQSCTTATSCFVSNPGKALHCVGLSVGGSGVCRPYCDVLAGNAGCVQVPRAQLCAQIGGAPAGYGYCQPQ